MKHTLMTIMAAVTLAACSQTKEPPRVTHEKPAAPAPKQVAGRTEPIFYNGKTYSLRFSPAANGVYDLALSGMSAAQGKDAVNVGTSAIRYFACPDGKTGKLTTSPRYVENRWIMAARCG